jgi:WD40 repeat protein
VLRLGTVRLRHGGTPTAALFLPDGKSLVSAAPADRHVAVWDVETGREVRRFTGVRRPLSLALSPDAKTLAVGEAADPYNVVLFEASSGRELGRCCGHRDEVTALAFLPDGKRLVSGSKDGSVHLWDPTVCQELRRFPAAVGDGVQVYCLAISPYGETLAVAGGTAPGHDKPDHCTITLYDLDSGFRIGRLQGPQDEARQLQFTPDGESLISVTDLGPVRVWDVATGEVRHEWETSAVHFALRAGGKQLMMVDKEHVLLVRDLATGKVRTRLPEFPRNATTFALDPAGTMLATGHHWCDSVRLWDLEAMREHVPAVGHHAWIQALETTTDGRFWTSRSSDQTVRIWDAGTGREVARSLLPVWYPHSIAVSPDSSVIAAAGADGQILRWQIPGGKKLPDLTLEGERNHHLTFLPDGRHLLCSDFLAHPVICNAATGKPVVHLKQDVSELRSLGTTPDGRWVFSTANDGNLCLWDRANADRPAVVRIRDPLFRFGNDWSEHPFYAAASPDSHLLVVCVEADVLVFEIATRTEVRRLPHPADVRQVSFTPDGRCVAALCNGRVRLWEVATGAPRHHRRRTVQRRPFRVLARRPPPRHRVERHNDPRVGPQRGPPGGPGAAVAEAAREGLAGAGR